MSLLGPVLYMANRRDFQRRLNLEKQQEMQSLTNQSYKEINSYQNDILNIEAYIYKICDNLCFVITTDKVKMVIPRNSNKMYHINQRINIIKDYSKLPYSENKYICFFTKKYYYATEV